MSAYMGGRRILIVEDEKVVAETLAQILADQGYEVRVAISGEEATSIVEQWEPNLAILDIMLPRMNGIQLAILLKENVSGCGVLLFSGQPSVQGLIEKARSEGHEFEVLAKPVHPTVMLDAVSTMLNPGTSAPVQQN